MTDAHSRCCTRLPSAIPFAIGLALCTRFAAQEAPAQPSLPKAPFLAENDEAMRRMMQDMTIKPTGDVDRDFVAMMVPHHQGAIDMARALLRYGHNEQLKRIAQEIIVTQQQEIAAMRLAVGLPLPASLAAPTQPSAGPSSRGEPAPLPRHKHQEN